VSPAVSVVIATYNYGRYVGSAIESVQAQSFRDWELIVVDDGSTDNTQQVLARYAQDKRIRISTQSRQGQPAAKNAGIELTRAPLVAFLDADDQWFPTKLAKQVPLFEDEYVGVAYCRRLLMGPDGESIPVQQPELYRGDVLEQIFYSNAFICFSTLVMRRSLLEEVGGFSDIPLAIDYDLLLRVAGECDFDYVDEPLVRYRTGHGNLSRRTEERLGIALSIMDRAVEVYADRIPAQVVRQAYAETYANLGLASRDRSRLTALAAYGKSLWAGPARAATWKGLASLFLPESARRLARQALGRPADWRNRPLAGTAQTAPDAESRSPDWKATLSDSVLADTSSPLSRGKL
jgi:glycosyltransferase involved in cell wall biosynthesis